MPVNDMVSSHVLPKFLELNPTLQEFRQFAESSQLVDKLHLYAGKVRSKAEMFELFDFCGPKRDDRAKRYLAYQVKHGLASLPPELVSDEIIDELFELRGMAEFRKEVPPIQKSTPCKVLLNGA